MDYVKELREKYPNDEEFNEELYAYLTGDLPYNKYAEFIEEFIPVMDQYNMDDAVIDAVISIVIDCNIGSFINNELPTYVYEALHHKKQYFEVMLKVNKKSIEFANIIHFGDCLDLVGETSARGINIDKTSIISIFAHYTKLELIKTIIHEALHQATRYDINERLDKNKLLENKTGITLQKKVKHMSITGIDIAYTTDDNKDDKRQWVRKYRRLNEGITEYLTKKVMGKYYPLEHASYVKEVNTIERLIQDNIIDEDILIEAYANNNLKLLQDHVYQKTGERDILNLFNNTKKESLTR